LPRCKRYENLADQIGAINFFILRLTRLCPASAWQAGKTFHRSKKFLELLDCQAGVTNDRRHRVSIHGIIARYDNT